MISAIFLAAGSSKRMKGENKLTKKIKGIPLIKYSIKNILKSSIDEIIVVLGYQSSTIRKIIKKNKKIKLVINKNFNRGISSSIKSGLDNLSKRSNFFFICLADMPYVKKNVYNKLISYKNNNKIIVPTYKGNYGNPILFSKSMKKKIMRIKGDVGAKKIIKLNKKKIFKVKINDSGITQDFDTKNNFDFKKSVNRFRS